MENHEITQWNLLKEACSKIKETDDFLYFSKLLSLFGKYFELVQGIVFKQKNTIYEQIATYAFFSKEKLTFKEGEGLIGQAVKNKQYIYLPNLNEDYFTITSGLGNSHKLNLLILPLLKENNVEVVLELAFFKSLSTQLIEQMKELETCFL
jgi:GAF domain-containing protein